MENPFLRRATEFLRDEEAFLAIVSPEPVTYFLSIPGKSGALYDRLVLLRGTPGSGKTTLARLFEFPAISVILRSQDSPIYQEVTAALSSCGAIRDGRPFVLGCRLPLETDYRDFWESQYSEELKANLMTALLQARCILAWFRHLRTVGIDTEKVRFLTRPEAHSLLDTIGGTESKHIRARAASVENSIYKVMTALVTPPESDLPADVVATYRPFDIIERIQIPGEPLGLIGHVDLVPLAIFDDAHVLHPNQFRALERFLVRRELRIARWMLARFDVLHPEEALAAAIEDRSSKMDFPGVTTGRDIEPILLQSSGQRRKQRDRFRTLAKDMAGRYLRRMPLFNERGITVLGNLLGDSDVFLTPRRLKELNDKVSATQDRLRISDSQRHTFEEQIRDYWGNKSPLSPEVALSMLLVMMHRHEVRRGRTNPTLFEVDDESEADLSIPVNANNAVYEAANFQLFREYDRPYYFGIDTICDASSENAELFLQLSAELVEGVVTQISRNKPPTLTPILQHRLLRKRGEEIIDAWDFPHDDMIRTLVKEIAERCLKKSLEPNGAVIANAFGIPQSEFDTLAKSDSYIARVLQFAVAYNAITLVPYHSCKKKEWCLLELGGMVLLKYGLTLKRGGFIEGTSASLAGFLAEAKS